MNEWIRNDGYVVAMTYNSFDVSVFPVDLLYPVDVVAKIERLKASLLSKQGDHDASGPVEALTKQLLNIELVLSHRDAVHELKIDKCTFLGKNVPSTKICVFLCCFTKVAKRQPKNVSTRRLHAVVPAKLTKGGEIPYTRLC